MLVSSMALASNPGANHAPEGALRVALSRPFAVGQLTGGGRLWGEDGVLHLQGTWPVPGPRFHVRHTDPNVEVQVWRLMVPWIAVDAILHDDDGAVVVTVPLWLKKQLLGLMIEHGFTPRVRYVWWSSATWRARNWLMQRRVTPKW